MPTILLLALAAAVYPQLLAVVVVILTRPNPRLLLWACYLGCMAVSLGASIAILLVFRSRGSVAGTSSQTLGPAAYLAAGTIAVAVAIFAVTSRGRRLAASDPFGVRSRGRGREDRPTAARRLKSRAEVALRDGSIAIAVVVGALLGIPGPFDLVALGRLARASYGAIAAVALIVAFMLIKFVLIELPIAGYTIDQEGTADRVAGFSDWMHMNKLTVAAAIAALLGIGLIARGISGLG
jgi:hypothetical protein